MSLRAHTAMRIYLSEIIFVVGVVLVAIANGKKQAVGQGSIQLGHALIEER